MSDDDICPLCGREYNSKYKEYRRDKNPEFSDDVAVCAADSRGSADRIHYVHW